MTDSLPALKNEINNPGEIRENHDRRKAFHGNCCSITNAFRPILDQSRLPDAGRISAALRRNHTVCAYWHRSLSVRQMIVIMEKIALAATQ
jgi:hypothetical protein